MTIDQLLPRLESVRRYRGGWKAICPAHLDRDPSLSIIEGFNGRAIIYCHAGCAFRDIVAALGISDSNRPLSSRSQNNNLAKTTTSFSPEKKDDRRWRTLPNAMQACTPRGYKLVAWYFYTLTYARARYEKPSESGGKLEKIFLPFWEIKPAEWANFAPPAPRPLFRVADILARPGETVHYTEGEKCAHALYLSGYLATTGGGQSSDSSTDFTPLARRNVIVWPDNDAKGIEHAQRVAAKLQKLGCTVKAMPIPKDAAPGSDVVDWYCLKLYAAPLVLAREVFLNAKAV